MSKTAVKTSKKVAAKKVATRPASVSSRTSTGKTSSSTKSPASKKAPAKKASVSVAAKKAASPKVAGKKVAVKKAAVKKAVVAKKVVAKKVPIKKVVASKKAAPSPVKTTPAVKPVKSSPAVLPETPSKVSISTPASPPKPQASVRPAEAQSPVVKSSPTMLATAPKPAKVDPKLANAWKSKAGKDLTEAELLAMPDSEYMNEVQQDFFRARLEALKEDLLSNAGETTEHLREDTSIVPDPADRATIEEEHALELRTRDRERKLLKKISQALARLESGDYGYCDETGEPIGLGRLMARPTATLSLEAQQRRELKQRMFGD